MKARKQASATRSTTPSTFDVPSRPFLQPKCACSSGGGTCSTCARSGSVQRKSEAGPAGLARVLRAPGHALEAGTRKRMESSFGFDFSTVRIHADGEGARSARRVGALAYTSGTHVVFGTGRYRPGTVDGDRLIAHELAHVVQQHRGAATIQRQPDGGEEAAAEEEFAAEEAPGTEAADEEGTGVETEESSTADQDDDGIEELPQMKRAAEGAAGTIGGLEAEADRAAEAALAAQPAVVSVGAAVGTLAPRRQYKGGKGGKGGKRKPVKPKKPTKPQRCHRDSTRVADFPDTFISHIDVDITSPEHSVTLTWDGPNAASQPAGPFHSSPGAGCCDKDCDDSATSMTNDSRCTPKVTDAKVHGFACRMRRFPEATNVTWFDRSGVAFHYHPKVPNEPASHGCVRLQQDGSHLVYDNSVVDKTTVTVAGTWERGTKCWPCARKKPKGKSSPAKK